MLLSGSQPMTAFRPVGCQYVGVYVDSLTVTMCMMTLCFFYRLKQQYE